MIGNGVGVETKEVVMLETENTVIEALLVRLQVFLRACGRVHAVLVCVCYKSWQLSTSSFGSPHILQQLFAEKLLSAPVRYSGKGDNTGTACTLHSTKSVV